MSTKISQREARRLKKRVEELERRDKDRANRWKSDYVGGRNICTVKFEPRDVAIVAINTARLLDHYVVVTTRDDGTIQFFAVKP
jgi:hypothetical protein